MLWILHVCFFINWYKKFIYVLHIILKADSYYYMHYKFWRATWIFIILRRSYLKKQCGLSSEESTSLTKITYALKCWCGSGFTSRCSWWPHTCVHVFGEGMSAPSCCLLQQHLSALCHVWWGAQVRLSIQPTSRDLGCGVTGGRWQNDWLAIWVPTVFADSKAVLLTNPWFVCTCVCVCVCNSSFCFPEWMEVRAL